MIKIIKKIIFCSLFAIFFNLSLNAIKKNLHFISEIPITKEHHVNTEVSSIADLRENYSCLLKHHVLDPSHIVVHCFPTLEFLEHRLYMAPYISCQRFPPGEVLLGIIDNPKRDNYDPYCFIWAFPPSSYTTQTKGIHTEQSPESLPNE